MAENKDNKIKETILDTTIVLLEAQLRAVKRLKGAPVKEKKPKGMSQVDLVYDILKRARSELHINDIIDRVRKIHGIALQRESIVSALSKKVARNERFVRSGKNMFALREGK